MKTLMLMLFAAAPALAQTPPPPLLPPTPVVPAKDKPADPAKPPEPKKPGTGSLDESLDVALRHNADLQAADAKVKLAAAELNRVRHGVMSKLTAAHADLKTAKALVEAAELGLAEAEKVYKIGTVGATEVTAARTARVKAQAEVTRLENEIKSLRGDSPAVELRPYSVELHAYRPKDSPAALSAAAEWMRRAQIDLVGVAPPAAPVCPGIPTAINCAACHGVPGSAVKTSMADRIRKFLDAEVKVEGAAAVEGYDLFGAVGFVEKSAKSDVPLHFLIKKQPADKISLPPGKIPVGACLQAIEDALPDVRFVVREYGILVTSKDRVPDGAMRAVEFWKKGDDKPKTPSPGK